MQDYKRNQNFSKRMIFFRKEANLRRLFSEQFCLVTYIVIKVHVTNKTVIIAEWQRMIIKRAKNGRSSYEVRDLEEIGLPSVGTQKNYNLNWFPIPEPDNQTIKCEQKLMMIYLLIATKDQIEQVRGVDFLDLAKDTFDRLTQST